MPATPRSILALDVGDRRVGIATASLIARLPAPLTTLQRGEQFFGELEQIIDEHEPTSIVVGLPRGLDGQDTAQTAAVRQFVKELQQNIQLPVHWQDEALTSAKAEQELAKKGHYQKADVDALAATFILEDYLNEHQEMAAQS